MSVRTLVAIVIAFGAGSATSLPFVMEGGLSLEPLLGRGDAGSHDRHHAGDASGGLLHDATHGLPGAPADDHAAHDAAAAAADGHGDHAGGLGAQPGMQRPAFPPATGK